MNSSATKKLFTLYNWLLKLKLSEAKEVFELNNLLVKNAASKKKILIKKLSLDEEIASRLDRDFKGKSVWIINKVIQHIMNTPAEFLGAAKHFTDPSGHKNPEEAQKMIDEGRKKDFYISAINSSGPEWLYSSFRLLEIRDWIIGGLNGDISSIKDLNIWDMRVQAEKWHEELEEGGGVLNYKESNPIILDFREEDDAGFYWVDLGGNYSQEEEERMGHCGRASYGENLYSLREYIKYPGQKYTVNKSHLTFAVDKETGNLSQAKAKKNSKPLESLHRYIIPLLKYKEGDEYLIKSTVSSYKPETCFKISDLSDKDLKEVVETREDLIDKDLISKLRLLERGWLTAEAFTDEFVLYTEACEHPYFDCRGYNVKSILSDNFVQYDLPISSAKEYLDDINLQNQNHILDDINDGRQAQNKRPITWGDIPNLISSAGLPDLGEDNDDLGHSLAAIIVTSAEEYYGNSHADYIYGLVKEAAETYGEFLGIEDYLLKIKIKMSDYLPDLLSLLDEDFYEYNSDLDWDDMFYTLINHSRDPVRINIDERWTPYLNEEAFNEILTERLSWGDWRL